MTLRLRRGTDLERQSVVFQEGELVYITDTKDLYAGDGSTPGGIKVSNIGSPNALTQNLNLNGFNISGNGIITATAFVGDGSGLTNLPTSGLVPGDTYDIGIRGDVVSQDNTLLIDSLNKLVYGTFIGDGAGLTGVSGVTPGEEYLINIQGSVRGFDSSIIVDSSLNLFNGTLKGSVVGFDNTVLVDANANTHYGAFVGDVLSADNTLLIDSLNKVVYGTFVGDGSGLTGVTGVIPGDEYVINIQGNVRGFDSSILVDSSLNLFNGTLKGGVVGLDDTVLINASTNTHYGAFIGDGSGLTNLGAALTDPLYSINVQGNLFADDNSLIVDATTQTFYGTFVGDGSGLTNLPTSGIVPGEEYGINIQGSVRGFDSSIIVDPTSNSIYGNFIGDGSLLQNISLNVGEEYLIDIRGTVRGIDSSTLVDSVANTINGTIITASNKFVGDSVDHSNFTFNYLGGPGFSTITQRATDAVNTLSFERISSTIVNPGSPQFLGQLTFSISDPTPQNLLRGVIYSFEESMLIAAGTPTFSATQYADNQYLHLKDDKLCIGGLNPVEKLDVRGNGVFSGDVSAAAFKGSFMADDSTTIIDGISGHITAPGYIQFGSFTKAERDSLAAANGFVIYNTTSNKFQGYQNGAWINLDDGSLDP